jgi:hypothetical protein
MNVYKTRKTRKARRSTRIDKPKVVFHFYDDQVSNFEGVSFSPDETRIEHMMCSDNIKCHKVNNRNNVTYTLKDVELLLDRYLSKISNSGLKKYIKYDQMINYHSNTSNIKVPYYHPDRGMTVDDIIPLCDPRLRNIIVGFDMDDTLHQVGGIFNIPTNQLIKELSDLTESNITYNDIGEMYFGGKERLSLFKAMFQNLARTIGMENVHIITANPTPLLLEIIPDLYSKIFNVAFSALNVKVALPSLQQTKFGAIRYILDEATRPHSLIAPFQHGRPRKVRQQQ